MPHLLIPDLDDVILERLRQRAIRNARSMEAEAADRMAAALPPPEKDPMAAIHAMREELARSGQEFPDSTPMIREMRDR